MGLDPGSPGSHPGLKAGAKLLSYQGCPEMRIFKQKLYPIFQSREMGLKPQEAERKQVAKEPWAWKL